jgi:hypothetical protein
MKDTSRPTTVSRRDTIRLLPLTASALAGVIAAEVGEGAALACGAPGLHAGSGEPRELAALTAEHFEPLVGETFTVGETAMTLKEVRHGHNAGPRFRTQFAAVFRGPQMQPLQSEIMPLSHPAIGRYDVFVNQIGGGRSLEICFS